MKKKTPLEIFVAELDKRKDMEASFFVPVMHDCRFQFMQVKAGKAFYVYGAKQYGIPTMAKKLELFAIVRNDIIYLVNEYFFFFFFENALCEKSLPKNVKLLSDYRKERHEKLNQDIIAPMFHQLQATQPINDKERSEMHNINTARNIILRKKPESDIYVGLPSMSIYCVAAYRNGGIEDELCGFTNLDDEARTFFTEHKDAYEQLKLANDRIVALVKERSVVKPWEEDIASALLSLMDDSKERMAWVTFENEDISAEARVSVRKIMRNLVDKDRFYSSDFDTDKNGEATLRLFHPHRLCCDDIKSIKYNRKIIFQR